MNTKGVTDAVSARMGELKQTAKLLGETRAACHAYRARELHEQAAARAEAGALACHIERQPGATLDDLRGLGQAYAALPRALFIAVFESPPTVLLATSEDSGIHAGERLKAALAKASGRGGGSPRLAQGTLPEPSALDAVVNTLLSA